jgi:hypothetical protein
VAHQFSRLQIQFRGQGTQGTRAEERMQLLAENGLSDVAAEPRICHLAQSHLFHAVYNAGDGAVAVDQIVHCATEFVARQLSPENAGCWHPPLHDRHHPLQRIYVSVSAILPGAADSPRRSTSQFGPLPVNSVAGHDRRSHARNWPPHGSTPAG